MAVPRDADVDTERPGHRRLHRRHVAHHDDVRSRGLLGDRRARRPDPFVQRERATHRPRARSPGPPSIVPTHPTAPPSASSLPTRHRTTRSTARRPRRASRTGRPSGWRASRDSRSRRRPSCPTARVRQRRSPEASRPRPVRDRAGPGADPRRWPPFDRDGQESTRRRACHTQLSQLARKGEVAVVEERRRRAGSPRWLVLQTQAHNAMPATSISTVSAPRSNGGSGSSSKPKPVSGHQNTSVLFHAPSNTRWRNIPIGSPSNILRSGRRPMVTSMTITSTTIVVTMLCSARAPPNAPSASGSTEPTINRR